MHRLHDYVAKQLAGKVPVAVCGANAHLAEYAGSMFELRTAVEPHVRSDAPSAVAVYGRKPLVRPGPG